MNTRIIKVHSENNDFQRFYVLKNNRNKRHRYSEFFVEGVRNINEAINNKWTINALVYTREKSLSEWAKNILRSSPANFRFELAPELMQKLSEKEETSELIAIVKMPEDDLSRIPLAGVPFIVVFDRPSNKGNLGSIIRSCDALGVQGLILTGHTVDLYDPEVIRATMGSFFKVPVIRVPEIEEFTQWVNDLKTEYPGLRIAGASEKGTMDIDNYDLTQPLVLVLGNETEGLSWHYEKISDTQVRIPMSTNSSASSLNVACAASIIFYEVNRQRKSA